MAAELNQLIEELRQRGWDGAADHLALSKTILEAAGMLPSCLNQGRERSANTPRETETEVEILYGKASLKGRELALEDAHELDTLGLKRRARNALVRSGFSTIADLEWANAHQLLHLVDQLGRRSVREIAAKIERPWPYLLRADGTSTRSDRRSPSDGRARTSDGERAGGRAQRTPQPAKRKRRQP